MKTEQQGLQLDILRVKKEIKDLKSERGGRNKPRLASREAEIVTKCAKLSELKKVKTRNLAKIMRCNSKLKIVEDYA